MNKPHWLVKPAAAILLAVPALLLGVAAAEIGLRMSRSGSYVTYNPCLHRKTGAEFMYYSPNCVASMSSEHGRVTYHFNEDGLRDRPRAAFAGGAVLMLGDSITEGMYLDDAETIPRQLETKLGTSSRWPLLNGGIRYASPVTEYRLYLRVRELVPVKAVIQLLNVTDTVDERFYHAIASDLDASGIPSRFDRSSDRDPMRATWIEPLYLAANGHSYLLELLRQRIYFERFSELAESQPEDDFVLCGAIRATASRLRAEGVPHLVVFTPVTEKGMDRVWPHVSRSPADLHKMVSCAKAAGASVLDLSDTKPDLSWYVADGLHPTPAGVGWLVERIAPAAAALLARVPAGNNSVPVESGKR